MERVKIVINSHRNGFRALRHLLTNMKSLPEFPEHDVIVVVGGYYDHAGYEVENWWGDNVTVVRCNHNSIDFTGLIALLELFGANAQDRYLYLHDTCRFGVNFYKKLRAISLEGVSSIKIKRRDSMNMGIYSQGLINGFEDFLLSKKNRDEKLCMFFKSVDYREDHLFENDPQNILLDNYEGHEFTGPCDYYGTGTMRIVEYFPSLDLYKIKANWGQGTWTLEN